MIKIIITGLNYIDKLPLANKLIEIDDNLSIGQEFTTNKFLYDDNSFGQYIDLETLSLSYKNNALFYVHTEDFMSNGLTLDEYYNNDIFCINIEDVNLISDSMIDDNTLIVWLDTKYQKSQNINKDLYEVKIFEQRLKNVNYVYFLDESIDKMTEIILNYINGNSDIKEKILEEFE